MASVKIIARPEKARKDGQIPLYLRMTHKRRSKYRSLGLSVRPEHWQADRQRVSRSHPYSQRLNALLAHKRAEFEELALDLDQREDAFRRRGLRGLLAGVGAESFPDRAYELVRQLTAQRRHSTARNYRTSFDQFTGWLRERKGRDDLPFMDFDLRLAHEFRTYLEDERGNGPNTVQTKFAALRRVMNLAHREGLITDAQNVLRRVSTPGRKSARVIPTPGDMERIAALELEEGSPLRETLDLYLFSSRMAGMRFSDAVTLRWADFQGEHLQWRTRKTRRRIRLLVPRRVREIIDRYRRGGDHPEDPAGFIFPFLRGYEDTDALTLQKRITAANTRCNLDLKEIARLAGLPRGYSFHTSRHYFATESLRRGVRVEVLKEIMTHSSIEQTMDYVRITSAEMDAAMGE